MKDLSLITILLSFLVQSGISQTVIKYQKTFPVINASQIRPNDSTMYDLNKPEEIFAFIKKEILKNKSILGDDHVSDSIFTLFLKDDLRQSAIIFIRHGFDPKALTINLSSKELNNIKKNNALIIQKTPALEDSMDKINSFFTILKYKNSISKSDYENIALSLSDTVKGQFFLNNISSIMANPDLKKLFTELLMEEKNRLQKTQDNYDDSIKSGKASFVETKEIVKTVLHKKEDKFSDYLLETKKILIVVLGGTDDLQKGQVSIKNKKSFFAQSFEDVKSFISLNKGTPKKSLPCKVILLESSKIKPPSEISIKDSSIKEDISFTIHERNTASFQVGVVNNKFQFNNFSISNGNLVVKPDSSQKANWKSNLYALLELHIPRDIDNFRPIYKTIFKGVDSNRTFGQWLYDVTLSRFGVYGGFKISDDPLSKIHAGFNYAISKELYVNFGWTWTNDVVPQVTKIGDITSLGDALKYAKRKYSKGEFSWGLSFAPSVLIETLGLKKDTKKATAEK